MFTIYFIFCPSNSEDDQAVEINTDSCKILSEQEIFDHIREKAKNFPLFPPSGTSCSLLTEAIVFKKKLPRQKDLELDVIEVSESGKPTSIIKQTDQNGHINNYTDKGASFT